MNSIHDLGGMHGFGRIDPEANEPVFHHPWEARTFALNFASAASGYRNVDEFRHARERMNPIAYLRDSYYEHILSAMETLLVEKGLISATQLEDRQAEIRAGGEASISAGSHQRYPAVEAGALLQRVRAGASARRPDDVSAGFRVGDAVRVRERHPVGHTRAPRFVRGKAGTVALDHGVFVFPDTNAHGGGPNPQHVYNVVFESRDVWGPTAGDRIKLRVDLWENHLVAAPANKSATTPDAA